MTTEEKGEEPSLKNRDWGRAIQPEEKERKERFLSAQADAFAGANAEEKVSLLRSK